MVGVVSGDHFGASIFPTLPPALTQEELLALIEQGVDEQEAEEAAEDATKEAPKKAKMKTKKRAHKGA
ncbi:hypothetical protein K4K57_004039 [Colletotrichum sp. SAR 10_99]|nr:hypothetical protein K4K51_009479 [Colletotrichum sp. SAR 10_75]KAI8237266.1 hypothetical protein K4K55_003354 [Colletotrichum sp. SAR 10_96]KAI8250428.1 hypothetical protein K4K53_012652 [Colletotrichum sp. SAR 10_77]KAI8271819.1 hypothetical protein K4K56_002922 [Colletotrichum sp. SAR 10_98]KAJ3959379.1 hypothetical protein N0V92_004032 [Colletotrichum tropicale]KAJ5012580.1 hypothetical protein K4K57_004039 [Colletotrichum sp. SAR 10_99]